MTMIVLEALDYDANYAYAPPTKPAAINKAEIVSVIPISTRYLGACVRITLKNGKHIDAVGEPGNFA